MTPCPIVDDAILIAGLFRATVLAAAQSIERGDHFDFVPPPIHRAAIWQAARGGLSGNLLDDSRHPKPKPAGQAVKSLIKRLRPQLEELGDYQEVSRARPGHVGRAGTRPTGSGPRTPSGDS